MQHANGPNESRILVATMLAKAVITATIGAFALVNNVNFHQPHASRAGGSVDTHTLLESRRVSIPDVFLNFPASGNLISELEISTLPSSFPPTYFPTTEEACEYRWPDVSTSASANVCEWINEIPIGFHVRWIHCRVYRLSRTLSGLGGPKNFIY